MKVCFIGTSPTPTTRVRGQGFAKYLEMRGYETKVLHLWENPHRWLQFPSSVIKPPILCVKMLREVIRYEPDVIYLLKPLPRVALTASVAQRLLGSHFIFDSDDYELREWFHPIRNWATLRSERYLATHADAVVVASRMLAKHISSHGVPDRKIHYIPTGVDTDVFRPLKIEKCKEKLLVFTGMRYRQNLDNISFMLEALKLVAKERKDFEVWMIGRGDAEIEGTTRKLIERAGLDSNVLIMGWLPVEELPRILAQADIALHPLVDSFLNRCKSPTKLFEYMAMGLPVVSSEVGEARLIIEHAKSGMLCRDTEEFAESILMLLEDEGLAEKLGKSAREVVLKKYSLRVLSEKLASVIEGVIAA